MKNFNQKELFLKGLGFNQANICDIHTERIQNKLDTHQ